MVLKHRFYFCFIAGFYTHSLMAAPPPLPAGVDKTPIDMYMKTFTGFKDSNYPYYERPNGCGSGLFEGIPDRWSGVNFRPTCDEHDRCFMTLSASQAACNDNALKGWRADCERDIPKLISIGTLGLGLAPCYGYVHGFYTMLFLSKAVGGSFYKESHEKQTDYEAKLNEVMGDVPRYYIESHREDNASSCQRGMQVGSYEVSTYGGPIFKGLDGSSDNTCDIGGKKQPCADIPGLVCQSNRTSTSTNSFYYCYQPRQPYAECAELKLR